jgi:hypothetical protein
MRPRLDRFREKRLALQRKEKALAEINQFLELHMGDKLIFLFPFSETIPANFKNIIGNINNICHKLFPQDT